MKILNKIFGFLKSNKEQEKQTKEKELNEKIQAKEEINKIEISYNNIENLENFIKEKRQQNLKEVEEKAKENIKNCIKYIKEIKAIVSSMDENIPQMNKRLKNIIITNRKEFVNRILNFDLNIENEYDFEKIREKIFKTAQYFGEIDIEYGRYLPYAYSQMEEFRKTLKNLINEISILNSYKYKKYEEFENFKEKIEKYNKEREALEKFKNELKNKNIEKENIEKELRDITSSNEYELLSKLIAEKEKILSEKEEIGSKIYEQIASMSRILKKIKGVLNIKEIDLYLENPKIFIERENSEILKILNIGKKILASDEISKIENFERNFCD
ncbi:MAG: hypothetical protein ACK4YO_03205, partial [Candidatus Altarchaeaceae archaeon]